MIAHLLYHFRTWRLERRIKAARTRKDIDWCFEQIERNLAYIESEMHK